MSRGDAYILTEGWRSGSSGAFCTPCIRLTECGVSEEFFDYMHGLLSVVGIKQFESVSGP